MTDAAPRIRSLSGDDRVLIDALVPLSVRAAGVVPDAEGPGVPSIRFAKRLAPSGANAVGGAPSP